MKAKIKFFKKLKQKVNPISSDYIELYISGVLVLREIFTSYKEIKEVEINLK